MTPRLTIPRKRVPRVTVGAWRGLALLLALWIAAWVLTALGVK